MESGVSRINPRDRFSNGRRAVGLAGLWFLRLAIPFMLIRWWIKFGKIKTDDRDVSQARGTTYIVAAVWFVALGTAFFYR